MVDSRTLIPNSFQTPNVYIDFLAYYLTAEEQVVLLKAVREILGWHHKIANRQARISLSVFVDGKVSRDTGEVLCMGCGLSINAVRKALKALNRYRILRKVGQPSATGQMFELEEDAEHLDWDGLKVRRALWDQANHRRVRGATAASKAARTAISSDDTPKPEKPLSSDDMDLDRATLGAISSDERSGLSSDDNKETQETHLETHLETHGCAACAAPASQDPLKGRGQGETDPEALTPAQRRLASAAGLTAAANAAAGGTPWSVPGAAYEAPAPEALPGWERVLARRRWAGDVRPADVLALAVRFADAEHADLTPPAAADPSAVKDWSAALERLLLTANPPGAVPTNGDQAAWLDRRLRRATWIMDYIFARREAGDPDYSGFTICRPGSILKIAALAEQALREAQKGSTDDTLPAIDATAPPARGAGPGGARAAGRGGLAGSTHAAPVDPDTLARQREALRRRDAERQAAA